MSDNFTSLVEITEVIFDRMHVQINCPILRKKLLTYRICNTLNQAIRKGSFIGEYIELSMVHMPDGDYFFNLSDADGPDFSFPFYKRSEV